MARFIDIFPRLNRSQLDKDLNKLKNEKVDIDVNVNGQNNVKNTNKVLHDLNSTGRDSSKVFSDLRLKMGAYLTTVKAVASAVKGSIKTIKMYDDYSTDLANAMGSSREEAESYLVTLSQQGKELKATVGEMAEGADSLIRSGKSVAETETLLKDSLILSKVAKMESADATDTLLTVMNSYKKGTEEVIDTVDALCAVDMSSAASAQGLAISLGKSASAANMAGIEINKLIAYLAVMKEASPTESDEAIGNSMKSVLSRLNQVKSGAYVDSETGESLNDVEKVLTEVGISVRDVNKQFLSSEKIIDNVGQKWASFDSVTKRAVSTAMGGSYQYNRLISLFEGYSKVLEYTEIAQNSSGKSLEKFGNYEESIEAKTKLLQNSLESLAFDTFGNEFYGSVLDATTGLVQFAEKTEAVKLGLISLGVVGGAKFFTSVSTAIVETVRNLSNFNTAMDIAKSADIATNNFDVLLRFSNGLSDSQAKLVLSSKALSDQQRINILVSRGMSEQEARTTLITYGLATAEDKATLSTVSLSGAVRGLTTRMKMFAVSNPFIAFLAGAVATIGAVTVAIDALTISTEEAREKAEKSAQELSDLQSEIATINSELETTGQKIDEILAKDKIDPTDEEALKKLREQNDELERELRIKEALEKQAKKDASDAATEVFTSVPDNGVWERRGTTVFYEETRGAGGVGKYQDVDRDRMQASLDYMNQIVELNKEIDSLQKEQDKFAVDSTDFNLIQNKINSKTKVLVAVQKALDTYIGEFQTDDDNLVAGISEETDNILAMLDDIYAKYDMLMNYTDGTAITLSERLQDKFAHGADMSDGSTYSTSSDMDKQISSWINTLSEEDKKIMLSCELDNASLEELKKYLAEQKRDIEEDATPEITDLGISEMVGEINTKLKPAMDSLSDAWNDIFTEDGFTLENVDVSMLDSIKSTVDDLNEMEGISIDYSSFEELAKVLTNTESTATDVENSMDEFATAILNGVSSTKELDSSTAQMVATLLESIGVSNAQEIVFAKLNAQTEALALQEQFATQHGIELANASNDIVAGFLNQAGATETARMYLFQLVSAEQIFNNQDLNTAEKIAELKELATAYGQTAIAARIANLEKASADGHIPIDYEKELNALQTDINNAVNNVKVDFTPITKASGKAGKDAGDAYLEAFEKELSALEDLRDRGIIDESEYLERLRALYTRYFKDREKYLDEYNKYERQYLEGMLSLHDSALSGITKLIGKKIDGYQDAKDTAIESLEAEKEAAEEAYQAQIDLINDQIEAKQKIIDGINDEINAMQNANEERNRQIGLQKAQFELQKMMSQRTQLAYQDGQMTYRADESGIRDARENVNDAKLEIEIAQKEKSIDLIEDEIDLLEEQKNALEEMKDASNEYYDKLIKQQEKYYDSLIKNAESQKSKWEELAEIQEVAEAYSAIEQVFGDLGYSVEDVLNGSAGAFEDFKAKYISIISDLNSNSSFTEGLSYATGVAKEDLGSFIDKTKEAGDAVGELGNKGSELDTIANNMDNTASSAETLNTNTEGVNENLSGISDSLNTMPESTKVSNLATAFGELAKEIQNVATALGIGADASVSGLVQALTEISELPLGDADKELGIIAQFGNLKAKVDEVTNAISGGGSSSAPSKGTNNVASGVAQAGLNANAESGSANSLTGAIEEMAQKAEESLGSGEEDSEEGTIGKFNALKTAVQNVIDLIGTEANTSGSAEGAENLISAIQLQYDRATEILPLEKLLFEELLTTIDKCVVSLNKMVSAFNSIAELGGMSTLPNGGGGSSRGYAEGTVGKAFANGTGGYNGLPHDEKNALRSEYGQPELTVYPNGDVEYTDTPTMSDLPRNTVIFNEEQTKRIMNNKGTVLGNAYADGNAVLKKIEIPSYLRPLQEGDKGYELTQKFLAYQDKLASQIIPPVTAIERNMELMTRNINNVNTNNVNKPSLTINGGINVTCPGVTSKEVANQVGAEIEKKFFGMSNYAYQKSSITR